MQQILVIDDSEKIHPLIKAMLANDSVSIQSTTNPNQGLVLAESICPEQLAVPAHDATLAA